LVLFADIYLEFDISDHLSTDSMTKDTNLSLTL